MHYDPQELTGLDARGRVVFCLVFDQGTILELNNVWLDNDRETIPLNEETSRIENCPRIFLEKQSFFIRPGTEILFAFNAVVNKDNTMGINTIRKGVNGITKIYDFKASCWINQNDFDRNNLLKLRGIPPRY